MMPSHLVISRDLARQMKQGISLEAIQRFAGEIPILGVCLGHQAIGQAFGASVIRAREVMHGKNSLIHHNQQGVFKGA